MNRHLKVAFKAIAKDIKTWWYQRRCKLVVVVVSKDLKGWPQHHYAKDWDEAWEWAQCYPRADYISIHANNHRGHVVKADPRTGLRTRVLGQQMYCKGGPYDAVSPAV